MEDEIAERVARALHPLKVTLVVKASSGVIVEGYAFYDSWRADEKADDMRNFEDFNDNEDDVCVIYDVLVGFMTPTKAPYWLAS